MNPLKSAVLAVCLAAVVLLTGCGKAIARLNPFASSAVATNPSSPVTITAAQPRPLKDSAGRPLAPPIYPRVQVYKLNLPLGTFSSNDKVWKMLNEDAIDGKTAIVLAQNGLRAATATQAKWPDIAKLLERPGTSRDEFICQTDNNSSLVIVTHPDITSQTIFYVDTDFALQGRTFDASSNAIRFSMTQAAAGEPISISLEPFIRLPAGPAPTRFTNPANIPPTEVNFANLRLSAFVDGKDFLVLAPVDPKGNPFSVGGRFLSIMDKLPPQESVLIFVPLPADKPKH